MISPKNTKKNLGKPRKSKEIQGPSHRRRPAGRLEPCPDAGGLVKAPAGLVGAALSVSRRITPDWLVMFPIHKNAPVH